MLMRVRAKISYMAYVQSMTVNEFFLDKMQKAIQMMYDQGDWKYDPLAKERDDRIVNLI